MMFPLTTLLGGGLGALVGGASMYLWMASHEAFAVAGARKAAQIEGVAICNGRVQQIEFRHNEAVYEAVEAARAAAAVGPSLTTSEEIKAACRASEACRSRGAL